MGRRQDCVSKRGNTKNRKHGGSGVLEDLTSDTKIRTTWQFRDNKQLELAIVLMTMKMVTINNK